MNLTRSVRILLPTALLVLANPGFSDDSNEREQDEVREGLRRGTIMPLSRILTVAARHAPGDVIKIELEHDDEGALIYNIKVLGKDGQVRKLKIDARTGVVLRTKTVDPD